ncbi:MAG TPA: roadblock/LC7 domain-containing protein [Chthoniobacterales bacterium]|nr:roadblock/LC7 domain-containing protein [Chthoniobacterales bacterium]
MTIPFLSYFKRGKTDAAPKENAAAPKPVLPPLEKPSSERFSKTVMPNATRTIAPQDPFEMASRSTALGGTNGAATMVAPPPGAPRTIAFAPPSMPVVQRDLPPAVALALEPVVERVISLELGDVLAEMPAGYVKPAESIDLTRRILLKASEVERGMANGKPAVSLATVYQQVPEIFLRTVEPADASQLKLPFNKVLEQFSSLQVRADQERARAVPQVETPFLKVTLEDNQHFGTTMEPLETGDLPPVRVEPATAEAFAFAEPEPVTDATFKMPAAQPARDNRTQSPARIPFKLSPNGTDVPAPESVPASSGPSVPTSSPTPPTPTPVRIPFKMTPPSEDARPKVEPWLTAETLAVSTDKPQTPAPVAAVPPPAPIALNPKPAVAAEVKIKLALKSIVQELPPMQWSGDTGSVPEAELIEIPFALIEPQLAAGRISVTAKVFETCLPSQFRSQFQAGDPPIDVSLPLREVLKNLPTSTLRMRDDQVEQEAGANFATPFSAKAEEDAKRFNVPATPVAKPAAITPEPVAAQPEPAPAAPVEPVAPVVEAEPIELPEGKALDRPPRSPLQVALDTDDKLDGKSVVDHVNKIAGVKACAITFGDGLSLAGSLPPDVEAEGLCAMAPALMQRVENHLVDTKLGTLRSMTLSCTKGTVTFFMRENLCLGALHATIDLPAEAREKLSRVVLELSRKYSHPV